MNGDNLRIVSDGTGFGTYVYVGDTRIDAQITKISWSLDCNDRQRGMVAHAVIELEMTDVDLISPDVTQIIVTPQGRFARRLRSWWATRKATKAIQTQHVKQAHEDPAYYLAALHEHRHRNGQPPSLVVRAGETHPDAAEIIAALSTYKRRNGTTGLV